MEKAYVPSHLRDVALILVADRGDQTFPSGEYHQGWWVNYIADDGRCLMACGQGCPAYADQIEVSISDLIEVGEYF